MMMWHKGALSALVLGIALALSGCGTKGEGEGSMLGLASQQVLGSIKAKRTSTNTGPPLVVEITPQQLANTKVAALQVNLEKRGGSDFLRRIAQRTDDHPGTVSVWRASDGADLILRGGVVVGSRGIGADIISSDATQTVRAIAGARAGQGERRYFISNGDYTDTQVSLSCDIDNLGRDDTIVVQQRFHTVHLRETCIGGADDAVRIVNDYWVQPGSGLVRRSRQWTGPLSGYFEIILLKT